jgi:hypothetical protein
MSLKDALMFYLLLAYGNMLRKEGEEQRKYAVRLADASARMCKSIPEGIPIWMVLNIGAVACANGDMIGTIRHGMIVHMMKQELLQEAKRRKKEAVAACN